MRDFTTGSGLSISTWATTIARARFWKLHSMNAAKTNRCAPPSKRRSLRSSSHSRFPARHRDESTPLMYGGDAQRGHGARALLDGDEARLPHFELSLGDAQVKTVNLAGTDLEIVERDHHVERLGLEVLAKRS